MGSVLIVSLVVAVFDIDNWGVDVVYPLSLAVEIDECRSERTSRTMPACLWYARRHGSTSRTELRSLSRKTKSERYLRGREVWRS